MNQRPKTSKDRAKKHNMLILFNKKIKSLQHLPPILSFCQACSLFFFIFVHPAPIRAVRTARGTHEGNTRAPKSGGATARWHVCLHTTQARHDIF
jgi:hypothetical protein